jgi:hypothetical protein
VSRNTHPSLLRAAGTVAFAILFGQLMGLLRGVLVAQAFLVAELDAFFPANRVSETYPQQAGVSLHVIGGWCARTACTPNITRISLTSKIPIAQLIDTAHVQHPEKLETLLTWNLQSFSKVQISAV